MIDFLESRRIEQNYRWLHGDLFIVMNIAGTKAAEVFRKEYGNGKRILCLCGHGNNGGDGIISAKDLSRDNEVKVILFTDSQGNISSMNERAIQYGSHIEIKKNPDSDEIKKTCEWAEVIIDAMLGTGISGELRKPYNNIVKIANMSKKDILSIDIPTGLGAHLQINAKHTVTFVDKKPEMSEKNSGIIHITDIGFGNEPVDYTGAGEMVYFPLLKDDGHKGDNGRLHVIAGWSYPGAGYMSSKAAGASLVDLISLSVPDHLYSIFSSRFTGEIVVRSSTKDEENLMERASTILIGPGLGQGPQNLKLLERTLRMKKKFVLDADALRMLPEIMDLLPEGTILTPHASEFRQLSGWDATEENAIKFAKEHNVVILLKGKVDLITDGERVVRSRGGNPRLAMGGTGDMLAGLAAGFLCRGMAPLQAANLASFVNKLNAERIAVNKSYWFDVDELLSGLSYTMAELSRFIS